LSENDCARFFWIDARDVKNEVSFAFISVLAIQRDIVDFRQSAAIGLT